MPKDNAQPIQRPRGAAPRVRRATRWDRLWAPFWAIPLACTLAALLAGVLLPEVDHAIGGRLPFVFPGGPDGARSVLGSIAGAMISVTGLVFSVTMVVLQLASSQFTPRLLGTFLQSRLTQITLGSFVASFVYSLTVLRSVIGDSGGEAFVPQLSVTVAYLLVLSSVGLFLAFIQHITSSIQVGRVITRVGDETTRLIEELYPGPGEGAPGPTWSPRPGCSRQDIAAAGRHGHLTSLDVPVLVELARSADTVLTVTQPVGSFVIPGQTLAQSWGADLDDEQVDRLRAAVSVSTERTLRQDPSFGVRQLVDIAERALSPGVNDPTTAVQVINELHRILRVLVRRVTPSPYVLDGDGAVRLVQPAPDVAALLTLAVEEIAHYGQDSVQVPRRLRAMLADLEAAALPQHQRAIAGLGRLLPEA